MWTSSPRKHPKAAEASGTSANLTASIYLLYRIDNTCTNACDTENTRAGMCYLSQANIIPDMHSVIYKSILCLLHLHFQSQWARLQIWQTLIEGYGLAGPPHPVLHKWIMLHEKQWWLQTIFCMRVSIYICMWRVVLCNSLTQYNPVVLHMHNGY